MPKSARLRPIRGPITGHADIVVSSDRIIRIGRGDETDYPIPFDLQISTVHLSLSVNDEGLLAVDLGSTNGTFVNERRIQKKLLFDGDELRLGQSVWRIEIAQSISLPVSPNGPLKTSNTDPNGEIVQSVFTAIGSPEVAPGSHPTIGPNVASQLELIGGGKTILLGPDDRKSFGRTSASIIQFDDLQMSSCHFEIFSVNGKWMIEDRRSTNGLFVNSRRVESVTLNNGDIIKAGQTTFSIRLVPIHIAPVPTYSVPVQDRPLVGSVPKQVIPTNDDSFVPPRKVDVPAALVTQLDQPTPHAPESIRDSVHRGKPRMPGGRKPGDAMLIQMTGNQHTFPLYKERPTTIGKLASVDIRIQGDEGIADEHVKVIFTEGNLLIEDLHSATGTYLDGDRVTKCIAGEGSMLQIGDCRFLFSAQPERVDDEHQIEEEPESTPPSIQKFAALESPNSASRINPAVDVDHDLNPYAGESLDQDPAQNRDRTATNVTGEFESIDVEMLKAKNLTFEECIRFQAFRTNSDLKLYRGCYKTFDPIEICRRLLFAFPGYLVDVETIEGWNKCRMHLRKSPTNG